MKDRSPQSFSHKPYQGQLWKAKAFSPSQYSKRPIIQSPYIIPNSLEKIQKKIDQPLKAEDRILNLQIMLEKEKKKRHLEFSELISMINSIKIEQQKGNSSKEFHYKQRQFPMTPRNSFYDNDSEIQRSPKIKKRIQTYTPVYNSMQSQALSDHQKQFSTSIILNKNLQNLLLKIQKQTQINVSSIAKIQQQLVSARSMQKTPKADDIPLHYQKFVKEQLKLLKNQMQTKNKNLELTLMNQLDNKLDQRENKLSQKKDVLNLSILKIQIQNKIKNVEQKTQNQIFTLNSILQERFNFFKQSLLDEMLKNTKDENNTAKLTEMIIKQRERIDQLQETNGVFYSDLEKTIENIQKKFKLIKEEDNHSKEMDLLHIFRQQKQSMIKQISSDLKLFLSDFQRKIDGQIKNIQVRVDNLQNSFQIPPTNKLLKHNSVSTYTQKTIGTSKDHHEWTPPVFNRIKKQNSIQYDQSFEDNHKFLTQEDVQIIIQKQLKQIIQMVSQNCTFLQTRSFAMEQSIGELVWVLNGLVEKIKDIKG